MSIPLDKNNTVEKEGPVLKLPEVSRAQFKNNFIKTAVCELRFPAILEYETKPPISLQRELRKEYPEYEKQQAFNVTDPSEREVKHVLKSRKSDWLVTGGSFTADSANQSRLELLAREYIAGQLSTEESARLAIVSERVRRLIPRVTLQDFERLEGTGRELNQIESDNAELRRRIESLKNI